METDNAQNQNNAPASVDVNQPATQPEQALGEPAAQPMREAPAPEAMEQQQNEENRAGDGATAKRRKLCSIEPPVGAEGGQESFILNPANQRYAFKGYDAEYPSVDHLSCFKGTFRNTQIYSSRNYVIGSPGTTSGCSGAGVFSMSGTLYGICVSGRLEIGSTLMTLNSHLLTLQTKLSEPSYSHIIPGNYLLAFLPDQKRKQEQAED